MTLRVGIVGCGQISEHHARSLQRLSHRCSICALIDPREERRAAIRALLGPSSCPIEASTLSIASPLPIDAVLIAVPHDLHEAVTSIALSMGLHVLLEKHATTTTQTCHLPG